eukprot:1925521-Pyramimonas_sp.AAC.2
MSGSGVYMGELWCRTYCVEWNVLNASPVLHRWQEVSSVIQASRHGRYTSQSASSSTVGSIFSRQTNRTREARVYVLTMDQFCKSALGLEGR